MKQFGRSIAKLYPGASPIKLGGAVYATKPEIEELCSDSVIQSMFAFIANARSYLMFEQPLFDVEIIGGNASQLNWQNRFEPAPSDYAPIIFDIWENDIRRSSLLTRSHMDITLPVMEWKEVSFASPGILHPQSIVGDLMAIESELLNLNNLSQKIISILDVRKEIEGSEPLVTTTRQRG